MNRQQDRLFTYFNPSIAIEIMSILTIDVAQTIAGEWIVIECNDSQESGYAVISPFALWQNLIDYVTPKN
jgi:hypothetical protein